MQRSDFDYVLPPALIAQQPLPGRCDSRLLLLDPCGPRIEHHQFTAIESLLQAGDLLVVNDTRVLAARLHATKDSGGRVEILIERVLGAQSALAQVRASKPLLAGRSLLLHEADGMHVQVGPRHGELYELSFPIPVLDVLARHGHIPLPPYIDRADTAIDRVRYQTLFAQRDGAIAAPTAGLHFDAPLLERLQARGIARAAITLHVGAGTFQPIRTDDLDAHRMHAEWCEVSQAVVAAIEATRVAGGRVVAVGTTVVRALESAAASGELRCFAGDSCLFIRPGVPLRVVDALITNFHLPQSTLLALVATFTGRELLLAAYAQAVERGYRFFSYGDAMFIPRRIPS